MGRKGKVKVLKDGPYLVSGNLPLDKQIIEVGPSGEPEKWRKSENYPTKDSYALCRCGQSKTKPFCDGSHVKAKFDGTEKASRKKYQEQAQSLEGPDLLLTDAECLCASARFCHRKGGTWKLTGASENPKLKQIAIEEAGNCPSGRLVAWDKKSEKAIEPKFEPSISIVEDPQAGVSGPIWVKGGIEIEAADGFKYENRNRQTLCRCGKSKNKPFCDASHISAKFHDGDNSLKS